MVDHAGEAPTVWRRAKDAEKCCDGFLPWCRHGRVGWNGGAGSTRCLPMNATLWWFSLPWRSPARANCGNTLWGSLLWDLLHLAGKAEASWVSFGRICGTAAAPGVAEQSSSATARRPGHLCGGSASNLAHRRRPSRLRRPLDGECAQSFSQRALCSHESVDAHKGFRHRTMLLLPIGRTAASD